MNIRKERKKRLMTQMTIAQKLHISQAMISLIELGFYNLSDELLKKLKTIFADYDATENEQ